MGGKEWREPLETTCPTTGETLGSMTGENLNPANHLSELGSILFPEASVEITAPATPWRYPCERP